VKIKKIQKKSFFRLFEAQIYYKYDSAGFSGLFKAVKLKSLPASIA